MRKESNGQNQESYLLSEPAEADTEEEQYPKDDDTLRSTDHSRTSVNDTAIDGDAGITLYSSLGLAASISAESSVESSGVGSQQSDHTSLNALLDVNQDTIAFSDVRHSDQTNRHTLKCEDPIRQSLLNDDDDDPKSTLFIINDEEIVVNNELSESSKNENTKSHLLSCLLSFALWICLLIGSLQMIWVPHQAEMDYWDHIQRSMIFSEHTSNDQRYYYQAWKTNLNDDHSNHNEYATQMRISVEFFNITDIDINKGVINQQLIKPITFNLWYERKNIQYSDDQEYVHFTQYDHLTDSDSENNNHDSNGINHDQNITVISPIIGSLYQGYQSGKITHNQWTQIWENELIRYNHNYDTLMKSVLLWTGKPRDLIFNTHSYNFTILKHPNQLRENNVYSVIWTMIPNETQTDYKLHTGHHSKTTMSDVHLITQHTHVPRYSGWVSEMSEMKNTTTMIRGRCVDCWSHSVSLQNTKLFYLGIKTIKDAHPQRRQDLMRPLWITVPLLYRPLWLDYHHIKHQTHSIDLYEYQMQILPQLANTTVDNGAYLETALIFDQLKYTGIINLTQCYGGVSTFISMPDFWGSPELVQTFNENSTMEGMNKNANINKVDIDPDSGRIHHLNLTLQWNYLVPNKSNIINTNDSIHHIIDSIIINPELIDSNNHSNNDLLKLVPSYMINVRWDISKQMNKDSQRWKIIQLTTKKRSKILCIMCTPLLILYTSLIFYQYGSQNRIRINPWI